VGGASPLISDEKNHCGAVRTLKEILQENRIRRPEAKILACTGSSIVFTLSGKIRKKKKKKEGERGRDNDSCGVEKKGGF